MKFLKWCGSKRKQTQFIIPKILETNKKIYLEPFLGSGSVLLGLLQSDYNGKIYVNDLNNELINTWKVLQTNPDELIKDLDNYGVLDKPTYMTLRNEYNNIKEPNLRKASLFILLNRYCWGGVYMVNKKNENKIPYGHIKTKYDNSKLKNVSKIIQNVIFESMDYEEFINKYIAPDVVIYMDPPYFEQFQKYTQYKWNYEHFNEYLNKIIKICPIICSNTQEWYNRTKDLWGGHIPVEVVNRMAKRGSKPRREAICYNFFDIKE
jgi:DNA adenine methylase